MYKFYFLVFFLLATLLKAEPIISILYFDNLTKEGKYAHLKKALTEMLISDLHQLKDITFVEREKIESVIQEMALGQSGLMDDSTAPKVGKLVGAQYFISGGYLTEKKKILITYKIVEIKSAKVIASGNVQGKTGDILAVKDDLASAVAHDLITHFDGITLPEISGEDEVISMDRLAEFGKALDYKDKKDYQNAGIILKNIVKENPDYKLFKDELEDVENRLEDYDETREKLLAEKRNEPVTYQSFIQMSGVYASSMNYSKLLDYCREHRNFPPKSPSGSMIQSAEMIDYYIVLSLHFLNQLEGTIKEGEYFIKNYPTSMYYNSVKNFVTKAINELKIIDEKVKRAENKTREYFDRISSASPDQSEMLYYQIASVYYSETLYEKALDFYLKINVKRLEMQQIPGDLILFNIFMCHYSLLQKDEAKEVIRFCEEHYSKSDYLSGMREMLTIMPE
jgi:TolB-like protein